MYLNLWVKVLGRPQCMGLRVGAAHSSATTIRKSLQHSVAFYKTWWPWGAMGLSHNSEDTAAVIFTVGQGWFSSPLQCSNQARNYNQGQGRVRWVEALLEKSLTGGKRIPISKPAQQPTDSLFEQSRVIRAHQQGKEADEETEQFSVNKLILRWWGSS